MLCDICGKNPATVHLTEIINNQMSEVHLCEECARQKSQEVESQFGLADLLAGLADMGKQLEEEQVSIQCSNCGLTYEDFRKGGRLGCSHCYSSFRKYLAPLLKRIHGSSQHLGKTPVKLAKVARKKTEIEELKADLQRAIEKEEFEEAARLRDRIRELEKKK